SQKAGQMPGKDGKGAKGEGKPGDANGDEMMGSRVAIGRKGKASGQSFNQAQGQNLAKGRGQGEQPEQAAEQLELNDYSRKGMPASDAKEGAYQRLGGRRDGLPLGDYGESKDGQKAQLQRYSERLEKQSQPKQQSQMDDQQSRQPQTAQNPNSYALNGQPNMPGQSGAQTGSGARPGGGPGGPRMGFQAATGGGEATIGGQMPGSGGMGA